MSQILVKPEQKQKLLSDILKTTRVQQTQCALATADGSAYCAIGAILHEIYGFNGGGNDKYWNEAFRKLVGGNNLKSIVISGSMMHMNDVQRKSFAEIGEWLERQGL